MEKEKYIVLQPECIQFGENSMKILDSHHGRYRIPYRKIVFAFLNITDRKSGICYEPEIADVTRDMEGELIFYDSEHQKWKIQTDLLGKTAGCLLADLALHAPYILLGKQTWLEVDDEEEFAEAARMADVMRRC